MEIILNNQEYSGKITFDPFLWDEFITDESNDLIFFLSKSEILSLGQAILERAIKFVSEEEEYFTEDTEVEPQTNSVFVDNPLLIHLYFQHGLWSTEMRDVMFELFLSKVNEKHIQSKNDILWLNTIESGLMNDSYFIRCVYILRNQSTD